MRAQLTAMRSTWPGFVPVRGMGPETVIWFGDLTGVERTFHLSIEYGLPMVGRDEPWRDMPLVRVLRPRLVPNFETIDEAPLPHVYFEPEDLPNSPLCLYDPREGEWDPSMLLAATTVRWAERWLWHYEIWEATGRWHGGGRHADTTVEEPTNA
ncbi:MAG: hypothetical protein WBA25_00925 [Jannaschia sp.]